MSHIDFSVNIGENRMDATFLFWSLTKNKVYIDLLLKSRRTFRPVNIKTHFPGWCSGVLAFCVCCPKSSLGFQDQNII